MSGVMNMLLGARTTIAAAVDEFFNRVTLLLPGDGTNGAHNNTFLDSSSNNFSITRNGNTTQGTFTPFSQTGWSNFFGGAGSYLSNTSTALIGASTSTFTAEAWIYMTAAPTSDVNAIGSVITLDGQAASNANYMGFGVISNQKVTVRWFDSASKSCTGSSTLALNTWYHIALVANSNALAIYVNGIPETLTGTTTLTNRGGTSNEFAISANNYTSFTGYISNVRVNNTALYTSAFTPSTIPLASPSGTLLLTCQSNRFFDANTQLTAKSLTAAGSSTSVQAFEPFAPGTEYSAATVGGSGYFDGTGDYLSVAGNSALSCDGNIDFCVEAWIYSTTTGVAQTICQKSGIFNVSFSNYSLFIGSGSTLAISLGNSGSPGSAIGTYFRASGAIPCGPNRWTHVAWTKRYIGGGSVNEYRLFVNGRLDYYFTAGNPSDTRNDSFTTGIVPGSADPFFGYITGVRVTKNSIPTDYQTTSTTLDAQIFTVPSAPPTTTSQGASSPAILLNFTNAGITDATAKNDLETVGNAQISTTQSRFGGSSMYFDGTGDYLQVTPNQLFDLRTSDFTIEFWIYPTSFASASYPLYSQFNRSTTNAFAIEISTSGVVNVYVTNAGGAAWSIINAGNIGTLTLNTWNHVAFVRNGSAFRGYVNGTQGSLSTNSSNTVETFNGFNIGATGAGSSGYYTGYIDDFRISRYARYTASFTAPTAAFPLS